MRKREKNKKKGEGIKKLATLDENDGLHFRVTWWMAKFAHEPRDMGEIDIARVGPIGMECETAC